MWGCADAGLRFRVAVAATMSRAIEIAPLAFVPVLRAVSLGSTTSLVTRLLVGTGAKVPPSFAHAPA
jgi:hypothetical protein